MPEETSLEDSWPDDAAIHRYEVVVTKGPVLSRGVRLLGAFIWGIVSQGDAIHPGGKRIMVEDRLSGKTVATFVQEFGGGIDMAAHLTNELAARTADEFALEWL